MVATLNQETMFVRSTLINTRLKVSTIMWVFDYVLTSEFFDTGHLNEHRVGSWWGLLFYIFLASLAAHYLPEFLSSKALFYILYSILAAYHLPPTGHENSCNNLRAYIIYLKSERTCIYNCKPDECWACPVNCIKQLLLYCCDDFFKGKLFIFCKLQRSISFRPKDWYEIVKRTSYNTTYLQHKELIYAHK